MKNADFFQDAHDFVIGWSKLNDNHFSIPHLAWKWRVSAYWLYGEVRKRRLKVKTSGTRMKVLREEAMRYEKERIIPMIRARSIILPGLSSHP